MLAASTAHGGRTLEREEWLVRYRQLGLAAIPLRPKEKRPLRAGWQDPANAEWASAPANANIGILCGSASGGLVVLDFDTRDGPLEVLGMRAESIAAHTIVVRTARGWHIYAREAGRSTSSPIEGLDVRGEGSLVVAPPSIHPTGLAYELIGTSATIAPLSMFPLCGEASAAPRAVEVDWPAIESWISLQAPKLRAAWDTLRTGGSDEFDRSRADFAVARCLWEAGYSAEEVAAVLLALPGSKARERGEAYATRTALKARLGGVAGRR